MKHSFRLRALLQEMSAEAIRGMIDPEAYRAIKARDPRPEFRAYVVGHEGESTGRVVGMGNVTKRWHSRAIRGLLDKIKTGVKAFFGHNSDNSHSSNRQQVGEIVGKSLTMDSERGDQAVVVAYINPEYRDRELDVASIEALFEYTLREEAGNQVMDDIEINEVTGLALGSAKVDTPGFPGATLLGALQEMSNQNQGEKSMKLEEILSAVKQMRLSPSDVFSPSELIGDAFVKETLRQKDEKLAGEYSARQRNKQEHIDAEGALQTENKELKEKLAQLQAQDLNRAATEHLEKLMTERKLDPKQVAFVKDRLSGLKVKNEDTIEKDAASFLDQTIEKYAEFAGLFGVKVEKEGEKEADPAPGTGPNDQNAAVDKNGGMTIEPFANPEKNDFIPPM